MSIKALEAIRLGEQRHNTFVEPDFRFISFPRSGRTWIKFMTSRIAHLLGHTNCHGLFYFKHDGTQIDKPKRQELRFVSDKNIYRHNRVALLIRHPLDTVVSGYHICRHRLQQPGLKDITLSQWIRSERGLPFLVKHLNAWDDQKTVPKAFRLFVYERFLAFPKTCLRELVDYALTQDNCVTNAMIEDAVTTCSFENMRAHDEAVLTEIVEKKNHPIDRADENAYSVRKGQPGAWRHEISQTDAEWAFDYIKRNLRPFFREVYQDEDQTVV